MSATTPPPVTDRRTRRDEARAAEEARRRMRRRTITAVVAVVVVLALVGGSGWWYAHRNAAQRDANVHGDPTAQITPPNLTPDGMAIVSNAAVAKPGAIVVDIHMDYQCPVCKTYETFFGVALDQLIHDGDILARYHIRSFLDGNLGNDSSTRAGIAATCADTVGAFQAYHDTVFANQPDKEGMGFTEDQLRSTFARQAGITGAALTTFQRCYDNRETSDVVTTMEQANIAAGFRSTPTFLANGNKADLKDTAADAASLLATLTAAAQVTAAPAATTPTGGQAAVTTSPAAPLATKPTAPSIRANADDQLTPPDLTKDGTAIVSNAAQAKPDAITLDIHMDYQCPICKQYENFFGASLDQLIQSGDVLARYHIRSFLDINLNNTSSRLAGIAATCADTVGKFQAYHNTVFAHQPSEGTGFTDDQLRNAFAGQAGIAGAALTTFQRCYDTRATLNVVENMENLNYAAGITGTPTFLANGAKVDLTQTPADPASILATLKAAARTS